MDDKTNHMHESKLAYHSAIGQWTTDERGADRCVQLAQAAAAIALAEATQVQAAILDAQMSKPQFVQIGEMAYNLDHVQIVNMIGGTVGLFYADDDQPTVLDTAESTAFLAWWNKNTNVVRLDAPEEAK